MEKLDRPVNRSWFGEGEIVDADLLVDLLETYRFGKDNVPADKIRFKAVAPANNTTELQDEEDDGESQGLVGNTSVHESAASVSSNSDPIILDTMSETGSNEETDFNWLESNSTNLPNVENERQQNAEEGEIEEEEEEGEIKEEDEELEGEIEDEKDEDRERSLSESDLEKLLAMQEKYELYCPSCSSCITRNVIVKKWSHEKLVDLPADLKPNVPVVNGSSDIHVAETHIGNDDQEDKEEGYILTCLACLKDFLRLGARFLRLDYARGKPVEEPVEAQLEEMKSSNTTELQPHSKPYRDRFAVELLKSTVYGGLTETITSLGVVSSASASGSSTGNILALTVANLAGGLIVLAQNLQDLRNNSEQEKDRYEELLGRRANFRMHNLVAVLSYILFGLIPPLVYAFSFYETGIKNYKLVSVFSVSLVCVILLGMIKVYVRKPPYVRESPKSYLSSAAYYTSIVVASSGISYVVGDIMGKYIGKLGWFSLDRVGITSPFDGTKPEEYRFTSF
ncbi:unnamed protein product [Thlaspi arvense]|uniref:Membrane protein of ER body-like protein n=1 Tax=Thlaspi arvense TaxID=13288 RepID=A0AAU9RIX6_THLAR|nr:unnamed protein product [Thlaspi arvense]